MFWNRLNSTYFLPAILILTGCSLWPFGEKWERNPDLELLVRDDSCCLFNPVWSPDGRFIYYLRTHRNNRITYATSLGIGGELWKINLDTRESKFLLKGPFCSLAISHDGSLLALSYETGDNELEWDGGPLILVDTSGNILDTLPTGLPLVLDVEFGSDDSKLYYYAYDKVYTGIPFGFYRINLDGSGEELVKEEGDVSMMKWGAGFCLCYGDSICYGNIDSLAYPGCFCSPKLNPVHENYLVFLNGYSMGPGIADLYLLNLSTHTLIELDADPFGPPEDLSGFESAYWSPDGEKLVISVGEVYGGCVEASVGILELWILHDVWESLEGGEK